MRKKTDKKKNEVNYEDDFDGVDIKNLRDLTKEEMVWMRKILPSPEEVARSLRKLRVTIFLDWDSVQVFQQQARKHKVSYQKMIRQVLRKYTENIKRAA